MSNDFDWMDNPPAPTQVAELRTEVEPLPVSVPQSYFIGLLVKSQDREQCERALVKRYPAVTLQFEQWWEDDDFLDALQKAKIRSLPKNRVTKADVLLDVRKTIDQCLTPQPILFKGEDTGFQEIKAGEAFRGLELLGKATKAWNDDKDVNVIVDVEILDWSKQPDTPLLDVTPPLAADEE